VNDLSNILYSPYVYSILSVSYVPAAEIADCVVFIAISDVVSDL
jgi:hypothetical protein